MVTFLPLLPQIINSFPSALSFISVNQLHFPFSSEKTWLHCFTCLDGYNSCVPYHTHTQNQHAYTQIPASSVISDFDTPILHAYIGWVLQHIGLPRWTERDFVSLSHLRLPPSHPVTPCVLEGWVKTPLAILDYPPYKSLNPGHHHRATVCIHINTHTHTVSYTHTKCNHNADLRGRGRATDRQLRDKNQKM